MDNSTEKFLLGLIAAVALFFAARALFRDIHGMGTGVSSDSSTSTTKQTFSQAMDALSAGGDCGCGTAGSASPAAQAMSEGVLPGAVTPGVSVATQGDTTKRYPAFSTSN